MKKILVLLICVSVVLISFAGCNQNPQTDVWDGTVAQSFAKGKGTEKSPYVIKTASQLAYLASEVNAGVDYAGKYFSLVCDLDLNNIEWTPIGNGTYSFNGTFDGKKHTISNLKLTNGMKYFVDNSSGEIPTYTIGLFGSCEYAVLKNLTVDKAEVVIRNTVDRNTVMAGVLAGTVHARSPVEISNVTVRGASIVCDFEQEKVMLNMRIGGVVGNLDDRDASFNVFNVHSDVNVSIKNGSARYNIIGGIAGAVSACNSSEIKNCSSYLSVEADPENCHTQENYFGAFGSISAKNETVSVSNVFSKVTTNIINDTSYGYSAYNAGAIFGEMNHFKQQDGSITGGYRFENLFGFVEQIDETTGEVVKSTQLYELPSHAIASEINVLGCEKLPENHGFDDSVWDLGDLSAPKIRNN
ncbi:MAG: hypothetical protein ACI3XI_02540 [Eubacteriales bacterium]